MQERKYKVIDTLHGFRELGICDTLEEARELQKIHRKDTDGYENTEIIEYEKGTGKIISFTF